MPKLFIAIAFGTLAIHAQRAEDALLPKSVHITGRIVDPNSQPLEGARIDHQGNPRKSTSSGTGGTFELDTRAPSLVVRKDGYEGYWFRTSSAKSPLTITLQTLPKDRRFPVCKETGPSYTIDGWSARFRFPQIPELQQSRQTNDIDYGERRYFIQTKAGPKAISHGTGPTWSFGPPLDSFVWRSETYEELTYNIEGRTITDARGKFANGNRWRHLGRFNETVFYSDIGERTAKIFDRLLDAACLQPESEPASPRPK
jgi:hypothetical protein